MLALTIRPSERIIIGPPAAPLCVVQVASVHGGKVTLAFTADRSLPINREVVARAKVAGLNTRAGEQGKTHGGSDVKN